MSFLSPGVTGIGKGWDSELESGSCRLRPGSTAGPTQPEGSRCWHGRHLWNHSSLSLCRVCPRFVVLARTELLPQSPWLSSPAFLESGNGVFIPECRSPWGYLTPEPPNLGSPGVQEPLGGLGGAGGGGEHDLMCFVSLECRSGRVQPVPKALQLHLQEHRGQLPMLLPPGLHPAGGRQDLQRCGASRSSREMPPPGSWGRGDRAARGGKMSPGRCGERRRAGLAWEGSSFARSRSVSSGIKCSWLFPGGCSAHPEPQGAEGWVSSARGAVPGVVTSQAGAVPTSPRAENSVRSLARGCGGSLARGSGTSWDL